MKVRSIKQLIEVSLSNKTNIYAEFAFGKLSPKQSKMIENSIGSRLAGAERIIDSNGIRHALRKHGSERLEAKHGQIAVTIDDFSKVPLILKEPDEITYLGRNRLKQDTFLYEKKIGIIHYVAEAVRYSKAGNKLVFQTMYKRK